MSQRDESPSVELVRTLIESQFPQYAHLDISAVYSTGTANRLFRLGDDKVIRLPATDSARQAIEKEYAWLPGFAPHITLAIPAPEHQGNACPEFPSAWSIYQWLAGDDGWHTPLEDLHQAALDLALFITELHGLDTKDGPRPGEHNSYRGVPLIELDAPVKRAIVQCGDRIPTDDITRLWNLALEQPRWQQDTWIHGDIQPGNWLSRVDRLTAIIDWGLLGIGDPAVDLLPAWNLLDSSTRRVFREALDIDDASWIRSQGWALFQSVMALPYYWDSNPVMVAMAQRQMNEILKESR